MCDSHLMCALQQSTGAQSQLVLRSASLHCCEKLYLHQDIMQMKDDQNGSAAYLIVQFSGGRPEPAMVQYLDWHMSQVGAKDALLQQRLFAALSHLRQHAPPDTFQKSSRYLDCSDLPMLLPAPAWRELPRSGHAHMRARAAVMPQAVISPRSGWINAKHA